MASYWILKGNEEQENDKTVKPWSEELVKGTIVYPHCRQLKAALFDLDGTLIDTEGQYTVFWGAMARKYRPDVPSLEYLIKGTTLQQIFTTYFSSPEVQIAITKGLNEWEAQMKYEFFPGALEFLKNLKAHGVRCALVTSSNMLKLECVARQQPTLQSLFDQVFTAEAFTASKPAPDCYLQAAKALDARIDECAVFEDAFTGLQAGMSSGIFTFGLPTYNSPEAIKGKCHYVLPTFESMTYEKIMEIINQHSH